MYKTGNETSGRIRQALTTFFQQKSAGGVILLLCAAIAMALANSPLASVYEHILHLPIDIPFLPEMSLLHWINDGLMAVFFLVVGLEIKKEFLFGELKSLSATILPIAAAIGGMIVPALIYTACNLGHPTISGWAIPMSTDIAFSLGVLAFAAKGVPKSIAVFLTALAIVDDLGGIIVIALFYSQSMDWITLSAGLVVLGVMAMLCKRNVQSPFPYIFGGILAWYAFLQAGIHPTVAGVLTGFLIPAGNEENQLTQPLHHWEHALSPWSTFLVMPIFALGNAGIPLGVDSFGGLLSPIGHGVIGGLFIGKPLGIFGTVFILIKLGIVKMPKNVTWFHYLGAGILAGIGFTMSIFLASLSFTSPAELIAAKASIVTASILSGVTGMVLFKCHEKLPVRVVKWRLRRTTYKAYHLITRI